MHRGVYLTTAALRFVQLNGQVRILRHASDVHATCKRQAIPSPRFPLASAHSIIVFCTVSKLS